LIFKLLFYASNIFHLQIYLIIQVKSEILTTQTNQVVSLFQSQNKNLNFIYQISFITTNPFYDSHLTKFHINNILNIHILIFK